ncbi:hypothetical protein EO92_12645 [Methanosarcina sp. 2.H.A.1B.4]|nr:hypothetical protein EO92_12645 [Methanosarcina sp. 2.H.A.1B.4]
MNSGFAPRFSINLLYIMANIYYHLDIYGVPDFHKAKKSIALIFVFAVLIIAFSGFVEDNTL